MHRLQKPGNHETCFDDDSFHTHHAANCVGSHTARCHMITTERTCAIELQRIFQTTASLLIDVVQEVEECILPWQQVLHWVRQYFVCKAALELIKIPELQRNAVPAIGKLSIDLLLPLVPITMQKSVEESNLIFCFLALFISDIRWLLGSGFSTRHVRKRKEWENDTGVDTTK